MAHLCNKVYFLRDFCVFLKNKQGFRNILRYSMIACYFIYIIHRLVTEKIQMFMLGRK